MPVKQFMHLLKATILKMMKPAFNGLMLSKHCSVRKSISMVSSFVTIHNR